MHLTCATAVAMCRGIYTATGFLPQVKWINDLIAHRQKLGGILTELSVQPQTGAVQYAVVGIGINCTQSPEDFPPELRTVATSLKAATGVTPDLPRLAAAAIEALWQMDGQLLTDRSAIMDFYRSRCITCGQDVVLLRADTKRYGTVLSVDDSGALLVRFDDGTEEAVSSGEVSVRGMYGYT